MTAAVHTPVTTDLAVAVGPRLFRKQVLPIGAIDYTDKTTGAKHRLNFDRAYLADLAASFAGRAYDSVKVFLADGQNAHNVDPERMRGTVKGLELSDTGLDALIEMSESGAALVADHPDLGVSARIVPNLVKSDGRKFPAAIQHVLATVDPVVTGMRPWEAVSLSNEDQAVDLLDLTTANFAEKEKNMPEITEAQQALLDRLAAVPEDRLNAILAEPATDTDPTEDEIAAALAELEADANADTPVGASLSAEAQAAIDLANSRAEQAETSAAATARELAKAQWATERQTFLAAGVDKASLDLAAPWCGGDTPTGFIDLSNAETSTSAVATAAADTIRKLLEQRKGTIDLSVIGETPDDEDAEKKRREDAAAYAKHAGITR